MSKLTEYMLVLTDDGAEHARYRLDKSRAMTEFGLSAHEQRAVLTGDPAIRAEILGEERPKPVPITTKPTPPPKP